MSLAGIIQNAWNSQAKWLVLLRPFSWLYQFGTWVNRALYQHGVKSVYTAPCPVMVIGNITVGGSGKTPLLIQLVKYLQQHQVKVGVISRGYGGKGLFPALVNPTATPDKVGDEPCLIVRSTQVPMAVGADRKAAIELLLSHYQLDLIISDDGLQHWALNRQIEWIVLDSNRGLGNKRFLPEGFLRESPKKLDNSTVIEHGQYPTTELNMHLSAASPYLLNPCVGSESKFNAAQNFHALVGIGYPQRFYNTLQSLEINQFSHHEFPDHYNYDVADLMFDDASPIITTEKDAVKILTLLEKHPEIQREIWVVPVQAVLSEACYHLLNQQLQQVDIHLSQEV